MILCIDIGNTNIKYGVFDGERLVASFRVASKRSSTADEYGVIVRDLLLSASIDREMIDGVIMSSVIPQLNYTMEHMCEYYLGRKPLVVGPGIRTGINLIVRIVRQGSEQQISSSTSAPFQISNFIISGLGPITPPPRSNAYPHGSALRSRFRSR